MTTEVSPGVRDLTASRLPPQPNRWRRSAVHEYDCAYHVWWLEREEAALGYETEMDEWEAEHPAPRLADVMKTKAGSAY